MNPLESDAENRKNLDHADASSGPSQLLTVSVILLLAFAFLGTRSLWEPDEGRYTNIALNMLETGDWVHPMRNEHVGHWTKPPLTYWAIAASIATFGYNAWGARIPYALAYLFCALMVWCIARRLLPGDENRAALVYATMLLPFCAAQLVTTDFLLSAAISGAMAAWIEFRFSEPKASRHWALLMWFAFGIAFMTKGPPGLLPVLVIAAVEYLYREQGRPSIFNWRGLLVFASVALPWYVIVISETPGLFDYYLGRELIDRIGGSDFERHAEWYGWLEIYAPTLLVGTLPWTWVLWRWLRKLPMAIASWRNPQLRAQDSSGLILFLWVIVPLFVLCLARSRLPLYLLPMFTPLALILASQLRIDGRVFPKVRLVGIWVVGLIALRLASAYWPTSKNSGDWAEAIRARTSDEVREVAFIDDTPRYGVHLHLRARVDNVSLKPFLADSHDPEYDTDLDSELAENDDAGTIYICKEKYWLKVRDAIEGRGYGIERLGEPYLDRVIFRVVKNADSAES